MAFTLSLMALSHLLFSLPGTFSTKIMYECPVYTTQACSMSRPSQLLRFPSFVSHSTKQKVTFFTDLLTDKITVGLHCMVLHTAFARVWGALFNKNLPSKIGVGLIHGMLRNYFRETGYSKNKAVILQTSGIQPFLFAYTQSCWCLIQAIHSL
jgi:hypothetical protein